MLILDRASWRSHRAWLVGVCAASLAALVWCVASGLGDRTASWRWPRGSSVPGFTLGVAGGLIIAFEMLLWPRKSLWRGRRLGRTKHWMIAHLWLGVLAFPLLLLHGGFHFDLSRASLAAVLMWLLLGVFASGIFGCVVQNIVPRLMLDRLPAETIASQIDHVLRQHRDEAKRLVASVCGDADAPPQARPLMVERMRQAGAVEGKVAEVLAAPGAVVNAEPLRHFFESRVERFLAAEPATGAAHDFSNPRRAAELFSALKGQLDPSAHGVVDRLSDLCELRRQFDLQRRFQGWLYTWLAFHVAMSVALFALMIAHIVLAMHFV